MKIFLPHIHATWYVSTYVFSNPQPRWYQNSCVELRTHDTTCTYVRMFIDMDVIDRAYYVIADDLTCCNLISDWHLTELSLADRAYIINKANFIYINIGTR